MAEKISEETVAVEETAWERNLNSSEDACAAESTKDHSCSPRSFTAIEFEEFVIALTPKRFELLRLATTRNRSIKELARASQRDRGAVSRDVAKLKQLGLVKVESVVNPGHGRVKIVAPLTTTVTFEVKLDAI